MTRSWFAGTLVLMLLLAPRAVEGAAEEDRVLADETALKAVGLATDGPGLVEFFRLRARTDGAAETIAALLKQLEAPELTEREKACGALIGIGAPALPQLRRAAKDIDAAESSALARRCLLAIEKNSANLVGAAARLLTVRRPTGAAETLIAYLPSADNESVVEEVKAALQLVAYRGNQPDPALVKALTAASPLQRATAIEVLCQTGRAEPRATLRQLLHDPVPLVRLQTGLALGQANDAEAIATLIDLLPDLPLPLARQAEDFLRGLAGDDAPKTEMGADTAARMQHKEAWKTWWTTHDGTASLQEFRKRIMTDAERLKGLKLIAQLGAEEFETREQASRQLLVDGPGMLPLLRAVALDPDLEIRRRVRALLDALDKDKATPLPMQVPRLVAIRKPAGAASVLLAYLPLAEDETISNDIQTALISLAGDGKPDPALVQALTDKTPVRRAAAGAALAQSGAADVLPAVRALLKDPDTEVRLRVGVALAEAREREAIPVLIALLSELPREKSAPAEEYLRRLAADRLPLLPTGEGDLRRKQTDAWAAWWREQGAKIELVERVPTALALHFLNYTLLVQNQNGMVTELGPDGKQRWQITGLTSPMDAQVLPGDRVLIAEYNLRRVTERNFKGEVLWEKRLTLFPIGCQRLASGNTLIVCRNQLLEVDRTGKEVFTYMRPGNDLMTAAKLRNGQIVCVTSQGGCLRLGADGKELHSFPLQPAQVYGNEILPNGHLLMPLTWQNKVVEYDPEGKVVWEATTAFPSSAVRLPNGRTLIATQQPPYKLIELDRQGKTVAETTLPTHVLRAKRR